MAVQIEIPSPAVEAFCHRHHIRRLSLFGSVLRSDFNAKSDIDVLVDFEPGARMGLIALAGMEIELGQLLGRRAEIHTVNGLNPSFRDAVLETAEAQYEHA